MRASAPGHRGVHPRVSLKILTSTKTIQSARSMVYRIATLIVALASAPAWAQSGTAEEKGPMTIDAARMEGVGELEVTARGNAEIKQDELTIFGEVLKYNREFGRVEADQGARLQAGVDRFFGPRLRYGTLDDTGSFDQ